MPVVPAALFPTQAWLPQHPSTAVGPLKAGSSTQHSFREKPLINNRALSIPASCRDRPTQELLGIWGSLRIWPLFWNFCCFCWRECYNVNISMVLGWPRATPEPERSQCSWLTVTLWLIYLLHLHCYLMTHGVAGQPGLAVGQAYWYDQLLTQQRRRAWGSPGSHPAFSFPLCVVRPRGEERQQHSPLLQLSLNFIYSEFHSLWLRVH